MPATSEPQFGSLTPSAAIFSPRIAGARNSSLLLVGAELADDRRRHVGLHHQRHVHARPSPERTSSSPHTTEYQ